MAATAPPPLPSACGYFVLLCPFNGVLKWRIKIDARLLEGGRRSRAILSNPQKKPSRRGISVSWPFNVVGSFPSRGAPSLPVPAGGSPLFADSLTDSLIGESTWRWLSSPAILAGRRRWRSADDTLCIARETRLRGPRVRSGNSRGVVAKFARN